MNLKFNTEYFLIGAFGAIVPALVSLKFVDPKTTFVGFSMAVFAGYILNNLIGATFGGLSVAFDTKERTFWDLVRLGIAAPALFQLAVTGANIPGTPAHAAFHLLSTVAYADEPEENRFQVKSFQDSEPSFADQVVQGFTKSKPERTFYLIMSERDSALEAKEFAVQIWTAMAEKGFFSKEEKLPFVVQIYAPYKTLKFSIVLGEQLNRADANEMVQALLKSDFKQVRIFDLSCNCFLNEAEGKK